MQIVERGINLAKNKQAKKVYQSYSRYSNTMLRISVSTVASVLILALVAIRNPSCNAGSWTVGLTTKDLQQKFTDKCIEFGKLRRTAEIYDAKKFNIKSCEQLWTKFIDVIDKKDPNTVQEGYKKYFKYVEDNFYKNGFDKENYYKDKV